MTVVGLAIAMAFLFQAGLLLTLQTFCRSLHRWEIAPWMTVSFSVRSVFVFPTTTFFAAPPACLAPTVREPE